MVRLTRHEKPLPKSGEYESNPNKMTINQHVIPIKHLLEWSSNKGMVEVFDIESSEFKTLHTKSQYFCVMRLWDQWTESVMLKGNEDNYQNQIELMKNDGAFTNLDYVMEYYVLLCVRFWVAYKERPDDSSIISSISHEQNQSELEDNELEMDGPIHIINSTINPDSQHMARQVVKMAMNQAFSQRCECVKSEKWLIYQSDGDDFILSDSFSVNFLDGFHVLPLNPKQVLVAESTYQYLEKNALLSAKFINDFMKKNAVKYYIKTSNSKM